MEKHPLNQDFVWSDHAGPFRVIDEDQARAYDSDGYFLLEDAFEPEIVEGLLPPFQKRVSFPISREFELCVQIESVRFTKMVNLNGMVDHQFGWLQGLNLFRTTAEPNNAVTHSRQVDYQRHTGKVL